MINDEKLQILLNKLTALDASDRLFVMRQNPMDSYRWTKAVAPEITARELREAIELALLVRRAVTPVLERTQ